MNAEKSMNHFEVNTWYSCQPDMVNPEFELCKICLMTDRQYRYWWHIVTYYNGRDLFEGSLKDCLHWFECHYCGYNKYRQQFIDTSGEVKEG